MKVLNNSYLDKIHGVWAQFVGGAFAGWALGEYVFSPARDQLVGSLKREHERLLSDFKNDKEKFGKGHFSFNGDL